MVARGYLLVLLMKQPKKAISRRSDDDYTNGENDMILMKAMKMTELWYIILEKPVYWTDYYYYYWRNYYSVKP